MISVEGGVILTKNTMFVQPLFNYKTDEWLAMVYGYNPQNPSNEPMIGFAFKTKQYAKEFFDLMKAYNNGELKDTEDNIKLSIIIESPDDYAVFVYPSAERKIVKEFMENSAEKFGKDTQPLVAQLTICKKFPYGEGSSLKGFREILKSDMDVKLVPFLYNPETTEIQPIDEIEPIIKSDILLTNKKLLDKESIEYQHLKNIK